MAKGGSFERKVATKLSLWWSYGRHDDLIWRSAGSGGRATRRGRLGKRTINSEGDFCPTGPDAQPLFEVLSFEAKKGYDARRQSLHDLMDQPSNKAFEEKEGWDAWYPKCLKMMEESGSLAWVLIHSRNKRRELAVFDPELFRAIPELWNVVKGLRYLQLRGRLRTKPGKKYTVVLRAVVLTELLASVDPIVIKRIARGKTNGKRKSVRGQTQRQGVVPRKRVVE